MEQAEHRNTECKPLDQGYFQSGYYTDLYFFLSKSDTFHDIQASSLVWLGVLLILSLKDCMVLRTRRASSQLPTDSITSLKHTWYDAASDELAAGCRHLEGACYSACPENGQGRESCPHSALLMHPLRSPAVMRTADL